MSSEIRPANSPYRRRRIGYGPRSAHLRQIRSGDELNIPRLTAALFVVLALVTAVGAVSWTLTREQPERPADTARNSTMPETTSSQQTTITVPQEDAPGSEIQGLPRYPDSVRVDYANERQGGLTVTSARYVVRERLDAVRGFYRGIFRSESWSVADVEYSETSAGGEWTFFVIEGEREATVRLESLGPNVEIDIRVSEPLPAAAPAPEPVPAPSPTPAPAPGDGDDDDYEGGDD